MLNDVKPLRSITQDEIAAYKRDGFVKLPKILPSDWVDKLREVMNSLYQRGVITSAMLDEFAKASEATGNALLSDSKEPPKGRFCVATDVWRTDDGLRALCVNAPLPELAAQLFKARKINFLVDQLFVKEPGAARRTAFHMDESYFNCTGEQCATFWIPVDVVDKANGAMGYVPGSHLWGKTYAPNAFVSQMPLPGYEGEKIPDIESNEEAYRVQYIETEPGDIIVHHYRTLHGSTGNTDPNRIRRAAALRFGGDDLHYKLRVEGVMTSANLKEGDVLDSPEMPVVWSA